MAGKIIVSTLQSDTDNSISFVANTGATIFSANLSHGIAGSFIGAGSITGDKIGATAINANNIVNGTITGAKLAANTVTGDVIGQNAISSNNIVSVNASVATVGTLPTARLPSGTVLQVVSATKTDTFSVTGQTFTDVTGLSVTITPTSSSSKILVMFTITMSQNNGGYSGGVRLMRGSTPICIGDADGARPQVSNWSMHYYYWENSNLTNSFLDSPATTSATTYKLQIMSGYAGQTVYINRTYLDDVSYGRYPSTITVMEIAA
jgi:hypothetical protein